MVTQTEVQKRQDEEIAELRRSSQIVEQVQAASPHATPGASSSAAPLAHNPPVDTSTLVVTDTANNVLIPLPERRTGVTVSDIRRACNLEGVVNDGQWNELNVRCHSS